MCHAPAQRAPLFGLDADRLADADDGLRARLGRDRYRRARSRGAALTDDDAVVFATTEIRLLRHVSLPTAGPDHRSGRRR